jgi:UDP-glucuronate 4-epimerase
MQTILITGGAGFIGSHLVEYLLDTTDYQILIIDNFDTFYDREIKVKNISSFINNPRVRLYEFDIREEDSFTQLSNSTIDAIIHLAAKAGVRPSIADPISYQDVNVRGTQNLLEFSKNKGIKQFVFASSSSVYGINPNYPWREADAQLFPISPYASTKISGELLGHVYSHLFNICFIALRFFTVYGPRQRPDLAIHQFARKLIHDQPATIYGDGSTLRDYTYVSDIIAGIMGALHYDKSMYEVINLGNNQPISLNNLIDAIETVFSKKLIQNKFPEQPGDVAVTYADISKAKELLGYQPVVDIKKGLELFKHWILS